MWPESHSSFRHFKPFAFLHPICDGVWTCSSIPLYWQQHHRNQDVNVVTEVFKPIALRPVVTSFLGNTESSTGVSAHQRVETRVNVSRDI